MRKHALQAIGVLLIVWKIIDFAYTLPNAPLYNIFWFSHSALILTGIGLIVRNKTLSGGIFMAVVGAEIWWAIDFFMMLGGYTFMGTTKYVLDFNWIGIVFQLGHVVVIPLAIFMVYETGMTKKSYLVTWAIALVYVTLGRLAPAAANINCAHGYCGLGIAESALYFPLFILLLILYAYLLNGFLCRLTRLCWK